MCDGVNGKQVVYIVVGCLATEKYYKEDTCIKILSAAVLSFFFIIVLSMQLFSLDMDDILNTQTHPNTPNSIPKTMGACLIISKVLVSAHPDVGS